MKSVNGGGGPWRVGVSGSLRVRKQTVRVRMTRNVPQLLLVTPNETLGLIHGSLGPRYEYCESGIALTVLKPLTLHLGVLGT